MDSETDRESPNDELVLADKRKSGGRPTFMSSWKLELKFPDEKSAIDHLTAEGIWSLDPQRCYQVLNGRKIHYHCNRAKINAARCPVLKCIFIPKDSEEVLLYKTKIKHHHDKPKPPNKKRLHGRPLTAKAAVRKIRKKFRNPMDINLKLRIEKLLKEIQSPKDIIQKLQSEGFETKPRQVQIRNFCSARRRQRSPNKWIYEKSFMGVEAAKQYLKEQKIWNYKFHNPSVAGRTYHYRCKLVPKFAPQCAARKYFSFNKYTNEAVLYQRDTPHTHSDIMLSGNVDVGSKTKWMLKQLTQEDRKILRKDGFRVLKAVGLQDCLVEPMDHGPSFHDQLFRLQQESCPDLNYQIKEEVVTDEDDYTTVPVEVSLYEGNEENNHTVHITKRKSRKPLFTPDWLFEEKFPNEQMALDYLAKDDIWHIDPRRVYAVAGGRKVHYRCNRLKINGPQCAAWKCLLYSLDNDEVSVYKKDSEHTHDSIALQYRKSNTAIERHMLKQKNNSPIKGFITGKKKRGRPFKNPLKNIIIDESTDETKPIIDSFQSHVSNDSPASAMEFITTDDSMQYVINYVDGDQISHENDNTTQMSSNADKSSESNLNWVCENSFDTFEEAKAFVKQNWCSVTNYKIGARRKIFYRCNMVRKSGTQCEARCYLISCIETNKVLFYRNQAEHTHDQLIMAGLASPTRTWKNTQPGYLSPMYLSENLTELITHQDASNEQYMQMQDDNEHEPTMNYNNTIPINEWVVEDKIPSKSMVASYLTKHNTWRCKYRSGRSSKVYYYCTTDECEAQMCLFYDKQSDEVTVYRTGKHNHDIVYEIDNLPLQFIGNELLPDSYLNSNIIMKEELIIDDEQMSIIPNENVAMDFNGEDDDDDDEQMAIAQKWSFEKKFSNLNEANEFLAESDNVWEIKSTTKQKIFYRCTYPCEPECPANLFFLIDKSNDEVLYFSGDQHVHPEHKEEPNIIPPSSTEEIVIIESDTEETIPEPTTSFKESVIVAADTGNVAPKVNDFTFKEKFSNLSEAMNKMRQETDHWVSTCTSRVDNLYRQYFWCNYNGAPGRCTCRVFLLGRNDSDEVLYYISNEHNHSINKVSEKDKRNKIQKSAKSTECTNEIVISDDSDKDSLNGDDVENKEEWIFETKFDDYRTAKHYMKNLNLLSFKSNISKYGVKEYYNCNLVISDIDHCPASKYLLYEDLNSDVLMYNRNIQHVNICTNVIPPLVAIQKRLPNVINLVDSDDSDAENNANEIMLIESDEENSTPASKQDPTFTLDGKWIIEKEFKTSQEAADYLKEKQIWSFKVRSKSIKGMKEFYRCNLSKSAGQQCAASKFIYTKYATQAAILFQTKQSHTHDTTTQAAQAYEKFESLDECTKDEIKRLVLQGYTPKQILTKKFIKLYQFDAAIEDNLHYFITRLRRQTRSKQSTSLEKACFIKTIENWLTEISVIPENDDTHYCVSFNVDYLNKSFRCFLSTRRLLMNAVDCDLVHIDSSCLLHWQENPITIVGTTDLDQKFHLFGIAICTNKNECDYEFMFKTIQKGVQECHKKIFRPECLMVDQNESIRNAFIKTFGICTTIGTCSKVVLSKIMSKLSTYLESDQLLATQMQEDILKIQKLSSLSLFRKATNLFLQKWREFNQFSEFLDYFKTNWTDENSNWFRGFRPFTPHTNKAIHDTYDLLKNNYIFRENLPLQTFRFRLQIELEQLSRCYASGGTNQFIRKTTIPITVYEKAIEWNNLEKQMEIVHRGSEIRYYISTGNEKWICEEKLQKYRTCDHKTFDEFIDIQYSFWYVRRIKNSNTLICNCPDFLESYVCEHSVGLASVLNIIKFPPKLLTNRKQNTVSIEKIVNYINSKSE